MDNPLSLEKLAGALTEAQAKALLDAAELLDALAGEGIGQTVSDSTVLFADEVSLALSEAFGLDDSLPFALRQHLQNGGGE